MNGTPRALADLPSRTTRFCVGIIAFDEDAALAETAALLDPALWTAGVVDSRWWVIGTTDTDQIAGSGQDHWLLGPDDEVWWWQLRDVPRDVLQFEPMGVSVRDWLVLAHLLRQAEAREPLDDQDVWELDEQIDSLAPGLGSRYPLPLPFSAQPDDDWLF